MSREAQGEGDPAESARTLTCVSRACLAGRTRQIVQRSDQIEERRSPAGNSNSMVVEPEQRRDCRRARRLVTDYRLWRGGLPSSRVKTAPRAYLEANGKVGWNCCDGRACESGIISERSHLPRGRCEKFERLALCSLHHVPHLSTGSVRGSAGPDRKRCLRSDARARTVRIWHTQLFASSGDALTKLAQTCERRRLTRSRMASGTPALRAAVSVKLGAMRRC